LASGSALCVKNAARARSSTELSDDLIAHAVFLEDLVDVVSRRGHASVTGTMLSQVI